jgi:hypothetical protein
MSKSDGAWIRTTRGRVKRGDRVEVSWWANSLQFTATGVVEEKPHRLDEDDPDRVRLKIAAGDRALVITDEAGRHVSDTEAGFLWDGWLFVKNPEFFRLDN